MPQAAANTRLTPAEYLAFERESEVRHEYIDGEIYAMAGGSFEHSLIIGNLIRELGTALKGRHCFVCPTDMRIRIAASTRYTYPDVAVVCGEPRFEGDRRDILLNPLVIVEVLSESTERYDRGAKFAHYRTLPSLADYVLVSQTEPLVEHFHHTADGGWVLHVFAGGDALTLASLDCSIPIAEIYDKVFDRPATEEAS